MDKTDIGQVRIMKILITIIVSMSLGFAASYSYYSTQFERENTILVNKVSELENNFVKLKKKLSLITDVDIKDYLELKDNRAKYEKANDILGKIMVIFLADLQLHFDKKILIPIRANNHKVIEEKVTVEVVKQDLPDEKDNYRREDRYEFEQDNLSLKSTKNKLKKIKLKKPLLLTKSVPMKWSHPLIRKMNGHFKGKLFLQGLFGEITDNIELSIDLDLKRGKVTGEIEAIIFRNGKKYSHLNARGENKNVLYLKNKPRQIILKMSPSSYLQLLYIKSKDTFIANFYDDHKYVGIAKIRRM
jgi:hypothetical protein